MRAIELFGGVGGLSLGLAQAGFDFEAIIDSDRYACDTLRENQRAGVEYLADWPVFERDVRGFDFTPYVGMDLLSGGPPCQPFSIGGKHRGNGDSRDMMPEAARAVREIRPKAFVFENVRGLLRPAFRDYFDYVVLQLAHPIVPARSDESWTDHRRRLQAHAAVLDCDDRCYGVKYEVLNAADYGVPQVRYRVFIVGIRLDQGVQWSVPTATHSRQVLLQEMQQGTYWARHEMPPQEPNCGQDTINGRRPGDVPEKLAWITVRDAIADLPPPGTRTALRVFNHQLVEGARAYKGHTGSALDWPAKTLKAGDHGVPGGENMLRRLNGSVRYFTVRESARLQTFPDGYMFHGSWTESMRQLGNAVPVALSRSVGSAIHTCLNRSNSAASISPLSQRQPQLQS